MVLCFLLQGQTVTCEEQFINWIAWILKNTGREFVTLLLPLCFNNTKCFIYATKTSDWGLQTKRFLMLVHERNAYEFLSKVNFLEKGFNLKYNLLIIVWYHFFVTIPTLFLPTSLHMSFLWKKWISKHLHIVSDSFFSLNFEVTDLKPNQPQPIATHFSFLFLN